MDSEGLALKTSSSAGNIRFFFFPVSVMIFQGFWWKYFTIFWVLLSQKILRRSLWERVNGFKSRTEDLIPNSWPHFLLPTGDVPWSYNPREMYTSPKSCIYNPRILEMSRVLSQPIHFIVEENGLKRGNYFSQISQWARAMVFKKGMSRGASNNPLGCQKDIRTFIYVIFVIIMDLQEVAKTELKEMELYPSPSDSILHNYSLISKEGNLHQYSPQTLFRFLQFLLTLICVCVYVCV